MADRKKQDWSSRLTHVWVLSIDHSDGTEIRVFVSEESLYEAFEKDLREFTGTVETDQPDDKARILELLDDRRYQEAAELAERAFDLAYGWQEHALEGRPA